MGPKSQPGRRQHGRDGLDVIQNHVRISLERVHRARLQGPAPRRPQAHVEEPAQVEALGQYLEAKMKVSATSHAETVAASPRRHLHGSDSSFGLEFKLSRILKQRKRRSGMHVAKPNLDQRSKLTTIKSRNGAAAQTVVAQHREREHNDNPLGLSENVLFAFRAVAHVWLARKRRKDRAMRENVTNKLILHQSRPKALSPAVFDIISKSFVSPVPALQFFDAEATNMPPIQPRSVIPTRSALGPSPPSAAAPLRPTKPEAAPTSVTPRGICYRIDSKGQRQSKMQRSTDLGTPRRARPLYASKFATSMDDAVMHTLNKRLKLRMAAKKQRIINLSDAFGSNQDHLKLNLSAKLAMHWAEREHLHASKLEAACLNDTNLPSFQVSKDQHLGRLRVHKARLLELCHTLSIFGAMLRAHEDARHEMTRSELHVLSLFRIVVDNNCVLTPVVIQGIASRLSSADLACPRVQMLFSIIADRMGQDALATTTLVG